MGSVAPLYLERWEDIWLLLAGARSPTVWTWWSLSGRTTRCRSTANDRLPRSHDRFTHRAVRGEGGAGPHDRCRSPRVQPQDVQLPGLGNRGIPSMRAESTHATGAGNSPPPATNRGSYCPLGGNLVQSLFPWMATSYRRNGDGLDWDSVLPLNGRHRSIGC